MKFMMNGALTIGTLDGANVEMHEALGDENIFLFGLTADEVAGLQREAMSPYLLYSRDPVLRRAVDQLKVGFRDGKQLRGSVPTAAARRRTARRIEYLLLADFASLLRGR